MDVLIQQKPPTPAVGSNSPVCSGETLRLTSGSGTGALKYTWTGPNGFSSYESNPVISNAATSHSGTYSLVVLDESGNCSSSPVSTLVSINDAPAILNTSFTNSSACTATSGSISLSGLLNNTKYNVSYRKNGSAPVIATAHSDASGVITIRNLAAATYSNISVALSECSSNVVGPITLEEKNAPTVPVAKSNGPICTGGTILLTSSVSLSGEVTYSWTGPNGF